MCQWHETCPNKPEILIISGCLDQHIKEIQVCGHHALVFARRQAGNYMHCYVCLRLLIAESMQIPISEITTYP
jgi:hypothetical protein